MTSDQRIQLSDPFPLSDVDYRLDSKAYGRDDGSTVARVVFYIDARAVMDRLDACGVAWSTEYQVLPDGQHVECRLTIDGVTRADVGEPSGSNGKADPMKGAYSDAFKRAAVHFGVGRYLYAIPGVWAPCAGTAGGEAKMSNLTHQPAKQHYIDHTGGAGEPDGPRQEHADAPKVAGAVARPTNARNGKPAPSQRVDARFLSGWWEQWLSSGRTRQDAIDTLGKEPRLCTLDELRAVFAGIEA